MAGYQGDIHLGDTIDIKFVSTAAATGAPTTLSGTPVISAYVGNSVTQITAGITLSVDFDSVTGLNNVRVVASSGNGYAAQSNVSLIITTGTVGGTSAVGYEVGSFSIDNRPVNVTAVAGTTQTARDLGAQLDATVSSRMATYTQPTGFLAATFPTTVASPTNITAGTITTVTTVTTVTNLTNAPTAGDFTAAMKTSLNAATPVATVSGDFSATMKTSLNAATPVASLSGDFTATMKTSIGTAVAASAVASVTGNVGGNVIGNVNGNVVGSVASVTARVTANTDQLAGQTVTAAAGVTFPTSVASPTNITAASGVALTVAYDAAKTAAQAGDVMKVSSGTGANQISVTSGVVASDLKKINGTTVLGDGSVTPWGP